MVHIGLLQPRVMPGEESQKNTSGGWLMTSVSPWGDSDEDAFDQALVELGLGDARIIEIRGAMLPMGFEPLPPRLLPMGSLVECHLAVSRVFDGGQASAGVGWAIAETPEGDQCAVVATITSEEDADETSILLKTELRKRMASRDLEVLDYEIAVDEVTSAAGHHGVVLAALILPDSLNFQPKGAMGRVREMIRELSDDEDKKVSKTPPPQAARRSDGTRKADGGMTFEM